MTPRVTRGRGVSGSGTYYDVGIRHGFLDGSGGRGGAEFPPPRRAAALQNMPTTITVPRQRSRPPRPPRAVTILHSRLPGQAGHGTVPVWHALSYMRGSLCSVLYSLLLRRNVATSTRWRKRRAGVHCCRAYISFLLYHHHTVPTPTPTHANRQRASIAAPSRQRTCSQGAVWLQRVRAPVSRTTATF